MVGGFLKFSLMNDLYPTPLAWSGTFKCDQMASAVEIRGLLRQGARQVIILNYWVWQEEKGKM
jgi:hypothetical protein